MKRSLWLFLLVAILALPAAGQETYSVSLAAANVNKLDLGRQQNNAGTCATLGLPANCSQADACLANPPVTGGASCTAADALAAGRRIYPNSQAGREGFITQVLVKAPLDTYARARAQAAVNTLRLYCSNANQSQADALCTLVGDSAGCGICDILK